MIQDPEILIGSNDFYSTCIKRDK